MSSSTSTAVSGDPTESMINLQGVEIPPFRSVDDFILDKARFEAPPINDISRWNNRILSNLLYYQTNYYAVFVALFVLASFAYAQDFVLGLLAVASSGGVAVVALSPNTMFQQTRRDHPLVMLGIIIVTFYFFYCVLQSVMVLCFFLLLPLLLILIHASTRLRNFLAKVNQASERLGLKKTLMGKLLDMLNLDVKSA